jgi:hypothetical protein
MTTQTKAKQRLVTTTTLVIDQPCEYTQLEAKFRLVRYVLPDALRYRKNSADYGRVHNTVRDQVDAPYKSFKHDRLDGSPSKWAIYVLYLREEAIPDLKLPWFNGNALPKREVGFSEIPLHLLLKLLHIAFFRGEGAGRFVGEDKCYVYARASGGDFIYCVEIELQGSPANEEGAVAQEFRVVPHARRFGKVEAPQPASRTLFGKRPVGKRFYFLHLRSREVMQEETVYEIIIFRGKKALIKYHDPQHLESSSGKIVYDFIVQFLTYLGQFGIIGHAKQRTFTAARIPSETSLPVSALKVIGVYDSRLRRAHPVEAYVNLLNGMHPDVHYVAISHITDVPGCGILVLLDGGPDDFEEDGVLQTFLDPYHELYAKHPEIPKQSINVNPHDPEAMEGGDYLDYPLVGPQYTDFALKFDVALSELYLKCAIRYGLARFPLPLLPSDRAYVRRNRYTSHTYTTALWFSGQEMHFVDLRDPEQSDFFYAMVAQWGVNWDKQYEALLAERRLVEEKGSSRDLSQFDIILGPDLFVAIEDLEERILYDYPEIVRRRQEQLYTYPIDELRLEPYYDKIKGAAMLSFAELAGKGLLDATQDAIKQQEVQSLIFYRRLQAYDALLNEIAIVHPRISYQDLTGGEWLERIARIFGSKANKDGQYHRQMIAGLYRKRGLFRSEKGQDVQLYQGIWHDATNAFLVGSPTGMNMQGQQRAQLVRRFQVMQGAAHFDREQMLLEMSVQFVRHRQFTVVPYFFHLIDLYVENILRY